MFATPVSVQFCQREIPTHGFLIPTDINTDMVTMNAHTDIPDHLFRRRPSRRCALAALIALLQGAASIASATLIDFDSGSSEFSDNFTEIDGTSTFTYGSNAGTGGGGGVSVSGTLDGLRYNTALTGFTNGTSSIEISVYFRAVSNTAGGANASIGTGLFSTATPNVVAGASSDASWLYVGINSAAANPAGSGTDFVFTVRSRVAGSTSTNNDTTSFKLTSGNWYKLTTVFTYDSVAQTFTASGLLEDYGTSGTALVGEVASYAPSVVLANLDITGAEQLYASLRTGNLGYGGASRLDNFSVNVTAIPEPSTAGLTLGAAMLVVMAIFRRRATHVQV